MALNKRTRFLLADDHELIREGLKRILLGDDPSSTFGEATTAVEVLQILRDGTWDIVILDLNLPGRGGLDVLRDIKAERPNVPVLVLSMYPEEQYGVRVIRAGASGYVTKAMAPEVIVDAVRRVLQGGKYIGSGLASALADAVGSPEKNLPHESLSDREDQVLRRIAAGQTVGEIAVALNLSVKTVSTYRANLLRKLALKNNSQVMRYAHDHGMLD